jgi:hypothetical protein
MKSRLFVCRLLILVAFTFLSQLAGAQTVFVSSKGKKYHTENCKILAADKKGMSVEEAKKEGYKACRKCKVKQMEAIKRKEAEEKKKKGAGS